MRKVLLALFCAASLVATAQSTVVFQVRIPGNPCSPSGVDSVDVTGTWPSAAGRPGNWGDAGAALTMTSMGGGLYGATVTNLPAGSYMAKFRTWTGGNVNWESSADRPFTTVVGTPTALGPFCFGTTDPTCSGGSACVEVTFNVDMRGVRAAGVVVPDTVHIAGSIQGWNPGSSHMTDPDGDGIYTSTAPIRTPDGSYEYKYVNGNAWGTDEAIPCACASSGNRSLVVPASSTTFNAPALAFGTCGIASTSTSNVTFRLDMSAQLPDANGVKLRVFKPFATTIDLVNTTGDCYEATVALGNGDYVYDFVNGTDENGSLGNTCGCEYFGGDKRRSLVVGTANLVLPTAIYEDCNNSAIVCTSGLNTPAFGEVNVTPNPFGASTVITFENSGEATLRISDLTGRVLSVVGNITTNTVSVERNNMAAGMYIATLVNAKGETASFKLVVE